MSNNHSPPSSHTVGHEVIDLFSSPDDPPVPPRARAYASAAWLPSPAMSRKAVAVAAAAYAQERTNGRKKRFKTDSNELAEECETYELQQQQQRRIRRATDSRAVNHLKYSSSDDDDDSIIEVLVSKAIPPKPELQVLDVFPDADLPAVLALLDQYGNQNVAAVLQHMAEVPYPKSERKPVAAGRSNGLVHMQQNESVWMHDYTSTESFVPTHQYVKEAKEQLLRDFPFLSSHGAVCCLTKFKNHYAVCHEKVMQAIKGTGDDNVQYDRVLAVFQGQPLDADQTSRIESLMVGMARRRSPFCLKKTRKSIVKPLITDAVLVDELKYVGSKVREWMEIQKARQSREMNKLVSQRDGTAVECSCCFDSYPIDDMVACREEGHLFCMNCLKSFTENLVFGNGNLGIDKKTKKPALEVKCFHGDGCSSGFLRTHLEKALPPKSLQKYDEVQFQVSIERAGLGASVCSCPKCGFQADVPAGQKVFECPVAECGYASCRECGEASHIPLRCNEVEKEKVTKGRLVVEEAISAAMIRKCPACKKGFIKSDGCNKITCGCGAFVCYLCQKKIKDYTHFCQTPHCTHKNMCTKCPLYSKAEEDDAHAMRAAGHAAAEQVAKDNAGNDGDVKIDVDGILKAK